MSFFFFNETIIANAIRWSKLNTDFNSTFDTSSNVEIFSTITLVFLNCSIYACILTQQCHCIDSIIFAFFKGYSISCEYELILFVSLCMSIVMFKLKIGAKCFLPYLFFWAYSFLLEAYKVKKKTAAKIKIMNFILDAQKKVTYIEDAKLAPFLFWQESLG